MARSAWTTCRTGPDGIAIGKCTSAFVDSARSTGSSGDFGLTMSGRFGVCGLLSLALVAGACDSGDAPNRIASVNTARPDGARIPISTAEPVTPVRTGGLSPTEMPWAEAAVSSDGRTLLIRFFNDCGLLADVAAKETDERVEVTLMVATDPKFNTTGDGPAVRCVGPAKNELAKLDLSRPLDGRAIYDGYDGKPRPVTRLG